MSDSVRSTAALVVLLAGLAVLVGAWLSHAQSAPETAPPANLPAASTVPPKEPPVLAGLDPAIERVLAAGGNLEQIPVEDLAMFRPEVARVLIFHGVVLTVPQTSGSLR